MFSRALERSLYASYLKKSGGDKSDVLMVFGGPFLFWRHSSLLGRHLSTLKHISDLVEHDFMEEYRSDDERHVAMQPTTERSRNMPPWQKHLLPRSQHV
ncbi:hypothetical protein TNCV_2938091 [Trichonephila clavipes]|nr:hypothetical protein TNCV_2938091 [Trichonephila clavipes]